MFGTHPRPLPTREGSNRTRPRHKLPSCVVRGWGWVLLLIFSLPAYAAETPPARVPASQAQAFQLGCSLGLPGARARVFVEAVKSLQRLSDDEAGPRIKELAEQARSLRREEGRALVAASGLLRQMAAPAALRAGPEASVKTLDAPLVLSKEQRALARTDADTASILATMDEAEAVKKDADSTVGTLTGWLTLTRGADAVWAADVGTLTAQVFVARLAPDRPQFALSAAAPLVRRAPSATPPAVKDALESLAPRGGNLAELASPGTVKLAPSVIGRACDALLSAFRATRLIGAPSHR